jgi:hypothetical protein
MRFRVLALDHDSTIARAGGSARRRESGDSSRRYLVPGLVELTGFETRDLVCHSLSLQLRDAANRGIDRSSDPLAGTQVEPMASRQFFMGSKAAACC